MQFDRQHARDFLQVVYGDRPGYIQVCSTGNWTGRFFPTDRLDEAADYAATLDGAQGTYFRATTVAAIPLAGKRGGAGDTQDTPMMWGDVDFGEVGHKRGEALPPTMEDALTVVRDAGLGAPTILIHSGGGLYPIWMLDARVSPAEADRLAKWTQEALLRASEAHGWTYGTGVSDLARVLRLPGSVNRKTDTPRACRIVGGSGRPISPESIPAPPVRTITANPTTPGAVPLPPRADPNPGRSRGPADHIDELCSWAEILEPAGWTFVAHETGSERWLRPGDATSEYSARAFEHNLVCHSESAGLPSGAQQRLTKARVYAYLWHGGSVSEAVTALLKGDNRGGLPARVVDEITGATMFGLRALIAPAPTPTDTVVADPSMATVIEMRTFLATYTRFDQPARLGRRIAWMKSDAPHRLPRHARSLVEEALAGDYPAIKALHALRDGLRFHGHVNPAAPRTMLAQALGALLNEKVTA